MQAETVTRSELSQRFITLSQSLEASILGQSRLVRRLLIALLADGHLLVEGAPGLAKTTAIKALSEHIQADFHRVQFTPDLLPADLTGTEIYRPQTGSFEFQRGPIFHNMVLADEVNRAPAKVQSALLEAMGERQVTVGMTTYPLPDLFLVMATQNPIEQEGTFPLPEAQLDRFLMHVQIGYPDAAVEKQILELARRRAHAGAGSNAAGDFKLSVEEVMQAREAVLNVHMAEAVERYLIEIILTTRAPPEKQLELSRWLQYGASPRGTIALDRCARAQAWLQGRDYVTPDDIHEVLFEVLRHRVLLSYEAEAEGVTPDQALARVLDCVPLP